MLSSLQGGSGRDFNPESTDREEGSVVTQNNRLVGARLDRTQTSGIRSLSGKFQTVSGRNLPADAGWETGTDLTAPRGRPRTSPQQLWIYLDVLTSCPPRCGSVGLRAELGWSKDGLPGPLREAPFLSLVLRGIPHKSSARKPSRKDRFFSRASWHFGFCGLQGAVLLGGDACPFLPRPVGLKKVLEVFCGNE